MAPFGGDFKERRCAMTFADSVLKGLDADKRARDARREQDQVLADAPREITEAVRTNVVLRYTSGTATRAAFSAERVDIDVLGSPKVDEIEVAAGNGFCVLRT